MNPFSVVNLSDNLLFWFLIFFFTSFGTFLGSFSNVVILRMASGKSVIFPPSSCPFCSHRLSAADLIPVLGWILLKGRCRYCKAPISIQYPLVEAAAGLTLAAAYISAETPIRFVANGSVGIIWMVVAVLWFRGEVTSARPFIYPFFFWLILGMIAGNINTENVILALGFSVISSLLIKISNSHLPVGIWFGVTSYSLVASGQVIKYSVAILIFVTLYQMLFPLPEKSRLSFRRIPLFAFCVLAMTICAITGNWGY